MDEKSRPKREAPGEIPEKDIEEMFDRSSKPGGRKRDSQESCVVLRHIPTGITVRCQQERSQAMNRRKARERLEEKVTEYHEEARLARVQQAQKRKRQNRKRPKSLKERILRMKRHRSELKAARKRPGLGKAEDHE